MKVVSNASPLIALSLIEKLYLLEELWEEIIIPEAVYYEVVIQGKRKPGASLIEKAIENRWIRVIQIKEKNAVKFLLPILDYGEAEAIVLAQEIQAGLVILDNREPRLFAHQVGLKVIGTIGIILKAYEKKLIKHPLEEIYKLKSYGFYIGDNLLKYIKSLLQERKL
jgi:predicted nucleic acid-binding protein